MLEILSGFVGFFRQILIFIDAVAFSLIDDVYSLIVKFSSGTIFSADAINKVMSNLYIIISIFALFRIALLLINTIINPDKLNEKSNGLGNIVANLIIMFVLLIFTPMLFNEAMDLQKKIVEGNYIQKIFIKVDANGQSPGKVMRSIAIGSLITLDDEVLEMRKQNKNGCGDGSGGACAQAIESYEEMQQDGFSFPKLASNIGVSVKNDNGDNIYVYNYMMIVTFIAGCVITYVLLSFGIDIAVRMVELTVLMILSPLFIATFIDPKSVKSGPFHNWLKTFGSTYASLFIKLGILSIMLLLLGLLGNLESTLDLNSFEKLIMLFAILIFVKKAPKWIGGMIGVEGDAGLGGLGIGKKLAGAALIGGMATKAARGLAGSTAGLAQNTLRNARHNRKLKKDAAGGDDGISRKDRALAKRKYEKEHGGSTKGFRSEWSDSNRARREKLGLTPEEKAKRAFAGTVAGVATGFGAGIKANKLTGAFKGGITASNEFGDKQGLQGKSLAQKGKGFIKDKYGNIIDAGYGSAADRYDASEKLAKAKKREDMFTTSALNQFGGVNSSKLVGGMGQFQGVAGGAANIPEVYSMMYASASGYNYKDASGKVIRDESGEVVITDSSGKRVSNKMTTQGGREMVTDEGAANIAKMYNTVQSSALQEYSQNGQSISQMLSSTGSLQTTIGNLQLNAEKISIPGASVSADGKMSYSVGSNPARMQVEASVSGLENLVKQLEESKKDARDNRNVAEEQQIADQEVAARQKLTELKNKETMENQLDQIFNQIGILQERNKNIEPIVMNLGEEYKLSDGSGIPMVTRDDSKSRVLVSDQARSEYLKLNADSINKQIKYFEAKKEEKK